MVKLVLMDKDKIKRTPLFITSIIILLLLIGAIVFIDDLIPSKAQKALPNSATNILEYYSGTVDFVRLLKADMSRTDYDLYADNLKLTTQFSPNEHADIRSTIEAGIGDAPDWWDPPSASSSTYFKYRKGEEYLNVLYYENATAYLMFLSW